MEMVKNPTFFIAFVLVAAGVWLWFTNREVKGGSSTFLGSGSSVLSAADALARGLLTSKTNPVFLSPKIKRFFAGFFFLTGVVIFYLLWKVGEGI